MSNQNDNSKVVEQASKALFLLFDLESISANHFGKQSEYTPRPDLNEYERNMPVSEQLFKMATRIGYFYKKDLAGLNFKGLKGLDFGEVDTADRSNLDVKIHNICHGLRRMIGCMTDTFHIGALWVIPSLEASRLQKIELVVEYLREFMDEVYEWLENHERVQCNA